ncbi:hypothetical protein COCVIDRAFT_96538 [Bipolaris victoriae FI3]|uniref:Uncharacterized protein n=1 Tax=Bipolaris victoriae (strain FI3) TaxID=930091 RepID=W7EPR5_BIPV3|nr:hypothetical protein COCVIDRAFT_96538 [Bipolaris victoriae FI3]
MLAGLQKYAQAATVGDLAVEFNAAALSIKDGIVAEATPDNGVTVRIGTEEKMPGTYTLVISKNGTKCDSPSSMCIMQPGLISSSLKTMVDGKMVFELVDPNKPAAQAPSVAKLSVEKLPLMQGSTQVLLNTTDGQPKDVADMLSGSWSKTHTVARKVLSATKTLTTSGGLLDWFTIPSKTVEARSRRTRRPKRPARNVTFDFLNDDNKDDEEKNYGVTLQTSSFGWAAAFLAVLVIV